MKINHIQYIQRLIGKISGRFPVLLLFFLLLTAVLYGCGGGGSSPSPAPASSSQSGGEAARQEATQASTPAPPPAESGGGGRRGRRGRSGGAAQPAAPAATPAGGPSPEGAQPAAQTGEKKRYPEDRIIDLGFNPDAISARDTVVPRYPQKIRRNIFRDIKKGQEMRKKAEEALAKARNTIARVKEKGEGNYSKEVLKTAEDKLREAENAYKSSNYLKAELFASKAVELADSALPTVSLAEQQGRETEFNYRGFYESTDGTRTAIITRRSALGLETLYLLKEGDSLFVERETGQREEDQLVNKKKIEYKVTGIEDDGLWIQNITEKKQPVRIPIARAEGKEPSYTTGEEASKEVSKSRTESGEKTAVVDSSGTSSSSQRSSRPRR